jgi:hypothetical protein
VAKLLAEIWKDAVATEPLPIAVVLRPKTTHVVDPEDDEQDTDFPALVAAESPATVTFEMSAEE